MAHGSTHVALSTRAESTTSTEAESTTSTEVESTTSTEVESTTSARRLRPLSFCPDSLEGFTAYHRYFEQRNYVTYRTTPCTTQRLAHSSTLQVAPHNLLHNTPRVARRNKVL